MLALWLLAAGCQEYGVHEIPAVPDTATLAVEPGRIDFGILEAGESATATFAITNLGPAPASLEGVDLVNSEAFTVAAAPQGSLAAGQSVDVTVLYTATTVQDLGAALIHSDATNPSLRVDMAGAARVARLVVEPGLLEFDSVAGESVTQSAFVRNAGWAPLTVELHYIDEPTFEEITETPYGLGPGESIEVPITWTPPSVGTVDGQFWVSSDAGDATVALHGDWTRCYGVAEAWDEGVLDLSLDPTGSHTLTNRGDVDVCMTHWMPFFSNASQDAALGKSTLDGDAEQIVIAANESVTFQYDVEFDPSWMCIEQTQVTSVTDDFWFFGAYVPEPLRAKMAFDYQEDVWDEISTNPVVLVGRERSTFDLEVGQSTQVVVEAMNLGRIPTDADVTEHVPPWLRVVDPGDARSTAESDGSTTLVWEGVGLLGAVDTEDVSAATIYDRHYLEYTVRLESCPSERSTGDGPSALWADAGFTQRSSSGSALVVYCAP